MAELSVDDVVSFTNGQLSDNDETQRMLDAALAAARNDVRWHVSPVVSGDVITLNGSGTNRLRLPTKKIVKLTSVVNDGVTLSLTDDVVIDPESGNLLIRNNGRFSNKYGGVVVTLDHGYSEAEAADWRQAILALVSNISQIAEVGRSDAELSSKQVDDVVYRWASTPALASIEPILAKYRLLWKWV